MKTSLLSPTSHHLALFATLAFLAGIPAAAGAYDGDLVKRVKAKEHKVKVKVVGGKAKIKDKANGKHKVKVKGRNGEYAYSLAQHAAGQSHAPVAKQGYGSYK